MVTRVSRCLAALLVAFVSMPALASSVYLELDPASAPVIEGNQFEVRLYLDAADEVVPIVGGGEWPAIIKGALRIEFNSTLATYDSFQFNESAVLPGDCPVPAACLDDVIAPDANNRVSIGFENAQFADSSAPPVLIGSFLFNAVDDGDAATGGGNFGISLLDGWSEADGSINSFLGISFSNSNPSFQKITPEFTDTIVAIEPAVVPVPAAAWLLMSALGMLGLCARSRDT